MKKRSTGNGTEGMGAWTVGMDLGDRTSHICVLDEGGTVVERSKVQTTREGLRKRFEERTRMRIALEVGTHSPWVSRLLKELGRGALRVSLGGALAMAVTAAIGRLLGVSAG